MKTADITAKQLRNLAVLFSNLYGRWQEEKGCEEFTEYKAAFKKRLPAGWSVIKMTKQPFYAEYGCNNIHRFMRVRKGYVEYGKFREGNEV